MASTYSSNLYIELIATGEQAGTWGTSTNNNFTNVFEEAIVGRVSVPFSDADVTLTATASNTNQSFRNVYLNCTGTNTASRNLVVPTINKNYIVENNTTGGFSIVVKTSAGTGITVPNGTKCAVYVDGTNVVIAFNYLSTLTVGTLSLTNALTTASGGTGLSSYTAGDLPYYASGTALSKLAIGTNGQILTSSGTAPQWSTLSGVAVTTFQTSLSGLTPSTATAGAVTLAGTLGTSSGGTGLTAFTANQIFYASSTSAIAQSSNLTFNGTTLTANTLNLTNALGVAYGGTGLTTLTSGYIPYGNGTSAFSSASTLSYSSTSGLTVNGITQAYNTTLYNVDGTLSSYASNNSVYLNGNAGGGLQLRGDGAAAQQIVLKGGSSSYISINTASTEVARFTSAGNLGIGTSSPTHLLEVYGTSGNQYICSTGTTNSSGFQATNSGQQFYFALDNSTGSVFGSAYSGNIYGTGAYPLQFWTNTTKQMTLDTSGNLGLGVTPSSSLSGWKSFEVAGLGQQWFVKNDSTDWHLTNNAYYNSGWKRGVSGAATDYEQNAGSHFWFNAGASGSGSAISWTQAMTLDSSGNLLVGRTSSAPTATGFQVAQSGYVNCGLSGSTSASTTYEVYSTGASAYRFYVDMAGTVHATATSIVAISDQSLKTNVKPLETGLAEVMRLQPRRFDWIDQTAHEGTNVAGFIAQEVQEVLPDLVGDFKYDEGVTKLGLKMGDMIPTLVKAIQDQQALIESLTAEVNQLKQKIGV